MKKKILIGSIIAVVIILLSSFSSVVGKVSSDDELVEFDVEFCGLGKKHTVQLTQQEADEVELLFDDIEQQLSEVETREDTEKIFKDAVVELDKYGLLGGLNVRQAQKLITGRFQNQKLIDLEKLDIKNQGEFNNSNFLCLTFGRTKCVSTWITNIPLIPLELLVWLLDYHLLFLFMDLELDTLFYLGIFFCLGVELASIVYQFVPWSILNIINLYENNDGTELLFTIGLNGIKIWRGDLKGTFPSLHPIREPAVIGFTGLRISSTVITPDSDQFFIGHSLMVKVEDV